MSIRVYFNKHGALPWSVDSGPGTMEYQTEFVVTLVPGTSQYGPTAGDNKDTPTAWFEYEDCAVVVFDNHIRIE